MWSGVATAAAKGNSHFHCIITSLARSKSEATLSWHGNARLRAITRLAVAATAAGNSGWFVTQNEDKMRHIAHLWHLEKPQKLC